MTEPIDRELLRSAMLASLEHQPPQQYVNFQHHVARVLVERDLPVQESYGHEPALRRVDDRRFREILWQLINQGLLVQGVDSSNPQWPFLSLTEWGEEYVRATAPMSTTPTATWLRLMPTSRSTTSNGATCRRRPPPSESILLMPQR